MSVSNVGSSAGLSQLQWRSTVRQARQDFEQLFQAMQSGDLSGAQQAYSALQQLQPASSASRGTFAASADATASVASTPASSTAGTSSSNGIVGNTIASDWSSLGQALQSGNLSSAQSAFSQIERDLQSSAQEAGERHRRREVGQAQAAYSAMQIANATSAAGTTTGNSANPVVSDINALKQALQSGDTTSAQNLLTRLQSDLQASGQAQGVYDHRYRGFALQSPTAAYAGAATAGTAGAALPTTTAA